MTDITQAFERADEIIARALYDQQSEHFAGAVIWEDLSLAGKRPWLDEAISIRTAALSSLEAEGWKLVRFRKVERTPLTIEDDSPASQSEPVPEERQHDSP